jgi:hypothetical protein
MAHGPAGGAEIADIDARRSTNPPPGRLRLMDIAEVMVCGLAILNVLPHGC